MKLKPVTWVLLCGVRGARDMAIKKQVFAGGQVCGLAEMQWESNQLNIFWKDYFIKAYVNYIERFNWMNVHYKTDLFNILCGLVYELI